MALHCQRDMSKTEHVSKASVVEACSSSKYKIHRCVLIDLQIQYQLKWHTLTRDVACANPFHPEKKKETDWEKLKRKKGL